MIKCQNHNYPEPTCLHDHCDYPLVVVLMLHTFLAAILKNKNIMTQVEFDQLNTQLQTYDSYIKLISRDLVEGQ